MGWLLLRTLILVPLLLAIGVLVLLVVALCAAFRPLLRRHTCVAHS